jgi:hypothetical protein
MSEAKQKLEAAIAALRLSVVSEFVPFSQSRNKNEKHKSLNWRVTLRREVNGPESPKFTNILTTDYSAGCAHAPSHKQATGPRTLAQRDRDLMVAWECEHGRKCSGMSYGNPERAYGPQNGPHLAPDTVNVIWSLVQDADVIDYGGFEDWADSCGYDKDSRSAEKIYNACLELALKLRLHIGEAGIQALREAGQDY